MPMTMRLPDEASNRKQCSTGTTLACPTMPERGLPPLVIILSRSVGRRAYPRNMPQALARIRQATARRRVSQRPHRGSAGFVVGSRGMRTARPWHRARQDARSSHSDGRYLLEGRCRQGQPVAAAVVGAARVLAEAPPQPAVAPGAAPAPGSGADAQRGLASRHDRKPQAQTALPCWSRAMVRRPVLAPARSSRGCARQLRRGRRSSPSQ